MLRIRGDGDAGPDKKEDSDEASMQHGPGGQTRVKAGARTGVGVTSTAAKGVEVEAKGALDDDNDDDDSGDEEEEEEEEDRNLAHKRMELARRFSGAAIGATLPAAEDASLAFGEPGINSLPAAAGGTQSRLNYQGHLFRADSADSQSIGAGGSAGSGAGAAQSVVSQWGGAVLVP